MDIPKTFLPLMLLIGAAFIYFSAQPEYADTSFGMIGGFLILIAIVIYLLPKKYRR